MSARYLDDLHVVLRGAGLHVEELTGWQTRARGGAGYDTCDGPWCVMWHHTASSGDGQSDAEYCTFGDADAPITNLVVGRDGVVWLCAAGATNTNGKGRSLAFSRGTVPADSMNSYAVGVELSNDGTGMIYPADQIDAAFTASTAICAAYGLEPDDVAQHVDYAPDRKVDPATAVAVDGAWAPRAINSSGSWNLDDLRGECCARAQGDDMALSNDDVERIARAVWDYATTDPPTGKPATTEQVLGWARHSAANADAQTKD